MGFSSSVPSQHRQAYLGRDVPFYYDRSGGDVAKTLGDFLSDANQLCAAGAVLLFIGDVVKRCPHGGRSGGRGFRPGLATPLVATDLDEVVFVIVRRGLIRV